MDRNTRSNDALRARAVELREQGWSNPRIRAELGLSGWGLTALLQGHVEPVHEALANRAKTELREQARDLRTQGWSYTAISRKLKVSESSCSLWLRDLPKPETYRPTPPPEKYAHMTAEEWADYSLHRMEAYRLQKEKERRTLKAEAAAEIGELSDREVLIAGVMIHWCEGTKSKPWRRETRVIMINSDPALILLYLRFLRLVGAEDDRLAFNLSIHETADIEAETGYWARDRRRTAGEVPEALHQEAQSPDGPQEGRGPLPRLPGRQGAQERAALPAHRGLGEGRHDGLRGSGLRHLVGRGGSLVAAPLTRHRRPVWTVRSRRAAVCLA
ncbi:hypothetical protein HDA32_000656 [Spinactinospora alkalitolerans]|uniref:Uncharacterized protein n=1 Tax=Spinactinospora alkalitolerans TaxID=687207 RepID=A0A852TML0_9ACTN|nr:hypothetical protein [Spinactinospora alkalitolerans]NYE45536.1 hypothetical protein [Spinactinospora alkalitolerans]